jgi:hypothetical protein
VPVAVVCVVIFRDTGRPKVFAGRFKCIDEGGAELTAGSEAVLGELRVVSRLAMGVERLRMVFTSSRIVLAHEGKRGVAAHSGAVFLGFLSAGLEGLFSGRRRSIYRKKSTDANLPEILASDRDNFSISYDEIVSVDLRQLEFTNQILILTRDDKFEFTTGSKFETVVGLFQGVGDRLTVSSLAR